MKTNRKLHLLLVTLLSLSDFAHGQGTAFTYSGRLAGNGAAVSGNYDLRFTLYDAIDGNAVAGPLNFSPVDVVNGLFTVRPDFGADVFTGPARWLHIEVRPTGGADFTPLIPRQEVTSSPYAIRSQTAGNVASGAVTANQLNTGGVAPAPGQFLSYNGGNLFWSEPGVAAGNIFSLNGNSAYYNAGNVGIGTSTPANKLTVRTPTLGYGIEHTDGDIRLGTLVGRATGYLGTLSNHKLTFFANDNGFPDMTMTLDTAGAVGIGTDSPTPGIRLEVNGATLLRPANGSIQFGSPQRGIRHVDHPEPRQPGGRPL